MPYVNKEIRSVISDEVRTIVKRIKELPESERDGAVNYTITAITARALKPETGWRYQTLARAYGTFLSAAAEFYRRLVAPYEKLAAEKNGDLEDYEFLSKP